jgi:hypothetical protein
MGADWGQVSRVTPLALVRVVRGCWRLRRVRLDEVRLLAMGDVEFAADLAQWRDELAVAAATLATLKKTDRGVV